MRYVAEFGDMIRLLCGDRTIALGRKGQMDIVGVAETLNQETAPLHAEIERLKAELKDANWKVEAAIEGLSLIANGSDALNHDAIADKSLSRLIAGMGIVAKETIEAIQGSKQESEADNA